MIQKESLENDKATRLLKSTVFDKQVEINFHLDTIASLKKELELTKIENERIDKKLMSYVASSYVIDHIVPQQPDATPKYPDGVETALNLKLRTIENELPESIDVTFSPSDTDNESQVIKTVVDQVLDEESDNSEIEIVKTHFENSNSDTKEDGNFLDRFIPKSDKVANDYSIIVVYTMIGTGKLYSDFEYPLQNARIENFEKVFKLVEIDISEKEWVDNGGNNKRNENKFKNKGVGFEKKMDKKNVKSKEKMSDVFVVGPSVDAEKEYIFSQKAIDDFNAAKKLREETYKTTFVEYDKRICYRCNEIGHMAKQCMKKLEKPVLQKPKSKAPTDVKGKKPMVSPVRILKRVEAKKMESVLNTEPKVFKDDVEKLEFELDKPLEEFPPIKKEDLKPKVKTDVPNFIFNIPKVNVTCDIVFGSVSTGLPRSIISKWIMDSGASRHMTGMLALLYDVKSINGGYVGFAGNQGGRIVGQGTLTNGVITFDKVNYIIELENNLLSISQICDKSFTVHFTKNEYLIIKPGFKIPEEMVLMRAPRENDLYVLDISIATTTDHKKQCFVIKTKATEKESIMWNRKMGHIHVRKMNFLVHNDLVEGVNLKSFHLNDDCVECKKGKQTKKSHPQKLLNSIRVPLERLHMDLFGPVNVKSFNGDLYYLVVTDDFTRFSWVVCMERKDQTFGSLMILFKKMETLYKLPIRRIRSDNGTEFKNNRML
ncbi:uncharacterized protein LOC110866970 [Helianthus annuus]|uniref:uncharacterized protein LOC110866970 n=1 Tax=Helianthus annuus TaxID=4232 RepID=UPI000B903665|nr:uncharacterized protein LOC110866970 [Helianthus annuus]